jgi:leucyl aminopeptidase
MPLAPFHLIATAGAEAAAHAGVVAVFADAKLDAGAKGLPRAARAALDRALASDGWGKLKPGEALAMAFPAGMAAKSLLAVKLPAKPDAAALRRAGAAIGKALGEEGALVLAGAVKDTGALAEAVALRAYQFARRAEAPKPAGPVTLAVADPKAAQAGLDLALARAAAVHFTRDLVNEPANILTTTDFANRLESMRDLGLTVQVLDEDELTKLGMRALLGVGQGSESPSKVVVMEWNGAADPKAPPLALIGKGVVFDTGGISIKPAGGMEEMVMDMGGAAVVAGVMRLLAERKAKARVVGLVGLVENMPDGKAQRPGDVVASMKGDTIEVINTDAEGRLVLADVMWYAQDRFQPAAMIDLATLTGAIIIALGHERAGVFGTDDALANALLAAAEGQGEGAWRMPLGREYDEAIKSRVADVKNVGGRPGGSSTAAAFLQRFVRNGTPWLHLDIAGVAMVSKDTELAPKGATGWGVRTLDALIRARFEG